MTIQWIGIWSVLGFSLITLLNLAILAFIYCAVKILDRSFYETTKMRIFWPLFILLAITLLGRLFDQAVSSGIVVLSIPNAALVTEITLNMVTMLGGIYLLFRILTGINLERPTR